MRHLLFFPVLSIALLPQLAMAQPGPNGWGSPWQYRSAPPYPPYGGYLPPPYFAAYPPRYPHQTPYGYAPRLPRAATSDRQETDQKPMLYRSQEVPDETLRATEAEAIQDGPSAASPPSTPLRNLSGRYEKSTDGHIYLYPEAKTDAE